MQNGDSQLAAPELAAVEVHGTTRSAFILRGAMAAGAVCGVSAVAPFVSQALAQSSSSSSGGTNPVDILNFALTLEYLETAFYKKAQGLKLTGAAKQFAQQFGQEEQQHVQALTQAIQQMGGKPAKMPKFSFPISNQASYLKLAQTLEDTGVGAYNGAGPALINNKQLLAAAGSIVQVEGRHAAAIRNLLSTPPAPDAFDQSLSMSKVLSAVKPLIK